MPASKHARPLLVARAFVLGLNGRAMLAVATVALSVGYVVLTGTAITGLRGARDVLEPELLEPQVVLARPGLAPFDAALAPAGSTLLAHAPWEGGVLGTVRPWPYGEEVVPGPYARAVPATKLAALGFPVAPRAHPQAPWHWVLVPPDVFDRFTPSLAGRATLAIGPSGAQAPGLLALPAPAARSFYEQGAAQVTGSLHLVVIAMGLTVAVFAGGVLRLEVLARERDLATLEATGGAAMARRVVVLRTLWLVGLGTALGTAGGLVLARVAGRALGLGGLRVEAWLVAEAAAVALLAGVLAGSLGGLRGLRAPLAARLGRRGPASRRFPGPVRFLLVTPRLAPSSIAAALVLASVSGVVLAAGSLPSTLFHPDDGTLVLGRSEGNPFRGSADRLFGEHATLFPGINGSSPEAIAPTLVEGQPVVVRGVHFDGWRGVDPVRLVTGRWPSQPGEATVGTRLARGAGLGVGDEVLVPGAYRATLRVLEVVGIHEGGGVRDDEIVTDLDTAGDLADLAPGTVHMIRLRASRDAYEQASPGSVPLLVRTIAVLPPEPLPFTEALARVTIVNLADAERAKTLLLRVNDVVVASRAVRLAPHSELTADIPFRVPEAKHLRVEVNPAANVTTGKAELEVRAPDTVAMNTTFVVEVRDLAGSPVPGAALEARGQRVATDAAGQARLDAGPPGVLYVLAREADRDGAWAVFVVDPAWALSPHLVADHAVITDAQFVNDTDVRYALTVTVTNLGGADFEGNLEATANGAVVGRVPARVAARAQATVLLEALVPPGPDRLRVAGLEVPLPFHPRAPAEEPPPGSPAPPPPPPPPAEAPPEQRPRGVADVLREKRLAAEKARETRQLSAQSFLDDVFASLSPSITLVVLATFFHAGAGMAVAVLRELRERGEVLATLAQLGATPEQLASRGVRDALLASLPGLLAGAAAALLGLSFASAWGFPAAFGHTIPVAWDWGFYLRVVGGLALVAALTAAWGARQPPPEPPRQAARRPLPEILGAKP